jgi:hypothetical protein
VPTALPTPPDCADALDTLGHDDDPAGVRGADLDTLTRPHFVASDGQRDLADGEIDAGLARNFRDRQR